MLQQVEQPKDAKDEQDDAEGNRGCSFHDKMILYLCIAWLEVPTQFLVDGGEETLVVEANQMEGEGLAGEGELGATGEVLPAGVGA